jgi:predicted helicase
LKFEHIIPDKKFNWINKSENDFDILLPLIDKNVKAGLHEKAIFSLFSRGVASLRDEWTYDFSTPALESKMRYFVDVYQNTLLDKNYPEKMSIKWDRELNNYLERRIKKEFHAAQITDSLYKPFTKMNFYFDRHFNGMTYQWFNIYKPGQPNVTISFNVGSTEFVTLVSNVIVCQGTLLVGGGSTQCAPLYRYGTEGEKIENITDWALGQFQKHYKDKTIGKMDIFHYVYAVLHHPSYRVKYEQNLKREFPRIPFYEGFRQWAVWGKRLMELHLNYETNESCPLERSDYKSKGDRPVAPTCRLIARKETGVIEVDTVTTLRGVPSAAWEYRLGTYSALEWVLERYKDKKPKDPTIAEKFNTYKFADYKESVVELLGRVCAVSVKTMEIVRQMPE